MHANTSAAHAELPDCKLTVTMLPKMTLRLLSSESIFVKSLAARALATSMSSADRCTQQIALLSRHTL